MTPCSKCHQQTCICCNENDQHHEQTPINPVDLFGSPFQCKEQKRTKRFASPNSPLPPDELDDLQACIESINDLLRSLGSESDPDNTRQLQLHFLSLKGVTVIANLLCGELPDDEDEIEDLDEQEHDEISGEKTTESGFSNKIKILKKKGKLVTAGRDFIQINRTGSALFIFYERLLSLSREYCEDPEQKSEFLDANQKTRRALAFNFGEFVSKDPHLINLFFGIPLVLHLKQFIGKEVSVKSNEGFFYGLLVKLDESKVMIKNKKLETEVDFNEVCYIEVHNLK